MKKLLCMSLFLIIASPAAAMDEECSRNRAIICDAVKAGDAQALRQASDANLPIGDDPLAIFLANSPTAEIAQILIDHGADVNERPHNDSSSQTMNLPPLCLAIMKGPIEVAAVLLQHGANVNAVYAHGMTTLTYAVHAHCDDKLKLLLSYGADPSMRGLFSADPSMSVFASNQTILDDARRIKPSIVPLLERQQKILALLKENRATNMVDLIHSRPISGRIRVLRN